MHTPDGFITGWICFLLLSLSALPVILALRNLGRSMTRQKALTLGVVAAVIFMAQMLNFPIGSGTSGHLLGGALALIVLGVDGAVVVMATVLLVQALV
ncbi:MAG: energy-coupling factor ABC transporter permease, partial [Candidatus Micrarchaeota archaeon]